MQGAGEQQQGQHALHQDVGKIDRAQEGFFIVAQTVHDVEGIQPDQQQREAERGDHDSDRSRQADKAVVQVGEECGDDETGCGDIQHGFS